MNISIAGIVDSADQMEICSPTCAQPHGSQKMWRILLRRWFNQLVIRYLLLDQDSQEKRVSFKKFWFHTGAICTVAEGPLKPFQYWLGYARFSKDFILHEDLESIFYDMIETYGGITYYKNDGRGIVYGFDTCHYGTTHVTMKDVIDCVNAMVDSIIITNRYIPRYYATEDKNLRERIFIECEEELYRVVLKYGRS
jgi:hypothetical protein